MTGKIYDGRNLMDEDTEYDYTIELNTLTSESGKDTSTKMYQFGTITDFYPWKQEDIQKYVDNQKKLFEYVS